MFILLQVLDSLKYLRIGNEHVSHYKQFKGEF